jgi:hypothetical protein
MPPRKSTVSTLNARKGSSNEKDKKMTVVENEDIETMPQFYDPVQLKDRENMVEFSDTDEQKSTMRSAR